jgi:hypothetical protein
MFLHHSNQLPRGFPGVGIPQSMLDPILLRSSPRLVQLLRVLGPSRSWLNQSVDRCEGVISHRSLHLRKRVGSGSFLDLQAYLGFKGREDRSCSQATSWLLADSKVSQTIPLGINGGVVRASRQRRISEWPSANEKPAAR